MTNHTITPREKAIITAAAKYFCSNRKINCRVRTHYDMERVTTICSPNALLYTDPFCSLDIADMNDLAGQIDFDLTPDGAAEIQIYVYLSDWHSLADTIRAVWASGVLVSVGGIVAASLAVRIDQKAALAKERKANRKMRGRYDIAAAASLEASARTGDPAELKRPTGFATTLRKNNCGVVALAAMTGVTYAAAEDAIWASISAHEKSAKRETWDGSCRLMRDWPAAAKTLGIEGLTHHKPRRVSVKTLMKDISPHKAHAVMTRGHVVTVKAGLIMDQAGSGDTSERGREARKMVTGYWTLDTHCYP